MASLAHRDAVKMAKKMQEAESRTDLELAKKTKEEVQACYEKAKKCQEDIELLVGFLKTDPVQDRWKGVKDCETLCEDLSQRWKAVEKASLAGQALKQAQAEATTACSELQTRFTAAKSRLVEVQEGPEAELPNYLKAAHKSYEQFSSSASQASSGQQLTSLTQKAGEHYTAAKLACKRVMPVVLSRTTTLSADDESWKQRRDAAYQELEALAGKIKASEQKVLAATSDEGGVKEGADLAALVQKWNTHSSTFYLACKEIEKEAKTVNDAASKVSRKCWGKAVG
jgi:hypothetical protein